MCNVSDLGPTLALESLGPIHQQTHFLWPAMGRPAAGYRENIALAQHHHQPGRESRLSIVCVTAGPGAGCTTPSAIISYTPMFITFNK